MSETRSIFAPKLQELGRIRIGDQVPTGKGKTTRPRKLDTFRLTSTNKPLLHSAAQLWGGDVTPWEDAPTDRQWQLTTLVNWLPVTVPPFGTLTQAYERWSGGGCQVRCNGERIVQALDTGLVGSPCTCPEDPEERNQLAGRGEACKAVTRLSVFLHDLPGIGVWRIDTSGYYAGSELMGIVPFLQSASEAGQYLKCALRLETRKLKRGGQTRVFPVVTLQPMEITMAQLLTQHIPEQALIAGPRRQIAAPMSDMRTDAERYTDAVNDLHGDRQHEERATWARDQYDALPKPQEPKLYGEYGTGRVDPGIADRVLSEAVNRVTGEIDEPAPEEEQAALSFDEAQERLRLRADIEQAMDAKKLNPRQRDYFVSGCGGGETPWAELKDIEVLRSMWARVQAATQPQEQPLIPEE